MEEMIRQRGSIGSFVMLLMALSYGCAKTDVMVNCGSSEIIPINEHAGGCPPPTTVTASISATGSYWRLASNPTQQPPAGSQCTSGVYCQGLNGTQNCGFGKKCYNWLYANNSCSCGCSP